jgi:excisionase family DNA binding protein
MSGLGTEARLWLSYEQVAERLGVTVSKVRHMCRDHELVAVDQRIPAECLDAGAVVKGLSGTLHLLADAGYDAEEAVRWLFAEESSLPGTPLQALRENRGTEVRRRAQALGF